MKIIQVLVASLALIARGVSVEKTDPLQMVMQLMDELTAKITKEGEDEKKAYNEFVEWCDDMSKTKGFEIKTATAKKGKLEATIAEVTDDSEAATAKIEDLAASISEDEKALSDATKIFEKEDADFQDGESELMETVDTLGRAVGILEKEMAKNPAAFAQINDHPDNFEGMVNALRTLTEAASLDTATSDKLVALVQATSNSDDMDSSMGAPDPATYKTHSTGILDVLEDMKEKAEDQLGTLRKEFTKVKQNYELLKQSLESQIAADKKDKAEQEDAKAVAEETKAKSEEELSMTIKLLKDTEEALQKGNSACMETASNHDASNAGRAEELKVIAEAKKIVAESAQGAGDETYGFVQVSSRSRMRLQGADVVNKVRSLAEASNDPALAQLASKIGAVFKYGAHADPFKKVKGLIQAMIEKLEKEAGDAAEEKAYCDEQMAKTEAKKSELEDDVAKLNSRIDTAAAKSTELKEDVKELQADLASLAKLQAEMDKIRAEEHSVYVEAKDDLEKGLVGVRKALGVLRDYYGGSSAAASMLQNMNQQQQPAMPEFHDKSAGAGGSIIAILEVCESDFAKNLANTEKEESDSAAEYEKTTQENAISKTTKMQDVKYKTKEFIGLDKDIAEMKSDLKSTNTELDAVNEYYGKIKDRCIAKPEPYEERKKRRENEIKGLKEALRILESETALVQKRKHGRGLRGTQALEAEF